MGATPAQAVGSGWRTGLCMATGTGAGVGEGIRMGCLLRLHLTQGTGHRHSGLCRCTCAAASRAAAAAAITAGSATWRAAESQAGFAGRSQVGSAALMAPATTQAPGDHSTPPSHHPLPITRVLSVCGRTSTPGMRSLRPPGMRSLHPAGSGRPLLSPSSSHAATGQAVSRLSRVSWRRLPRSPPGLLRGGCCHLHTQQLEQR